MPNPGDGLDADAAHAAADAASHAWGLPAPAVVQLGATGVFTAGDTIVRINRASQAGSEAIALAGVLTAAGVRVAQPRRDVALAVGHGLLATAWERIDADPEARVDWERVGGMVARVHDIDPRTVPRPLQFCGDFPWWHFDEMLDEAPAADRGVLADVVSRHRWWTDAARSGRQVLLHGDVHPGNVLVDASGPVLIDWDLLCVGPPEWDHAALATWTERWGGEPGLYDAFAAGYRRVVDAAMLAALAELRLVAATLMRFRRGRTDAAALAEARARMRYWHGDPDAPTWQAQA